MRVLLICWTLSLLSVAMFAGGVCVIAADILEVVKTDHDANNTPPPPFTDPDQTTNNALGGVASSLACNESVTTVVDMLLTAKWTASSCTAALLTPTAAPQSRFVVAKMTVAGAANSRVCIAPSAAAPAVGCSDANVAGDGFGCSLINAGDVCQWTIRPQTSGCVSWDTCHLPIFALASASAAGTAMVEISVHQ